MRGRNKQADYCEARFIKALHAGHKNQTFWARMEWTFLHGRRGAPWKKKKDKVK